MNKDFQDLISNAQNMFEKQSKTLDEELNKVMKDDSITAEKKALIQSLVGKFNKAMKNQDKNALNSLISEVTNNINKA